jgi:hypothetical protein
MNAPTEGKEIISSIANGSGQQEHNLMEMVVRLKITRTSVAMERTILLPSILQFFMRKTSAARIWIKQG